MWKQCYILEKGRIWLCSSVDGTTWLYFLHFHFYKQEYKKLFIITSKMTASCQNLEDSQLWPACHTFVTSFNFKVFLFQFFKSIIVFKVLFLYWFAVFHYHYILYIYLYMASRVIYQNNCPEVTGNAWSFMSPDAEGRERHNIPRLFATEGQIFWYYRLRWHVLYVM